jgi:hypothetical protein
MGSFLKALSKVGLVELEGEDLARLEEKDRRRAARKGRSDGEELDEILADAQGLISEVDGAGARPAEAPAQKRAAAPPPPPVSSGAVVEGRPLDQMYANARVPTSPYPAEQLLRLLDGLKAMQPAVRKAAVLAMDEADDDWTVADAIVDAQRKTQVLQAAQTQLAQAVAAAEQKAQADLEAQEHYKTEATATIRQQITELETLLEEELKKVSEERASIRTHLEEHRKAAARESHRLEAEVRRLAQVPEVFSEAAEPRTNPSEGN